MATATATATATVQQSKVATFAMFKTAFIGETMAV